MGVLRGIGSFLSSAEMPRRVSLAHPRLPRGAPPRPPQRDDESSPFWPDTDFMARLFLTATLAAGLLLPSQAAVGAQRPLGPHVARAPQRHAAARPIARRSAGPDPVVLAAEVAR